MSEGKTTIRLAVIPAINRCLLHRSSAMSFSSDFPFPTPGFYAYVLSQRTDTRTAHEKNVARFDALHIRHLSPFPDAFLPRCRLTPSFPLHPVRFTNSAHVALANDEKQFFDLTHLSFTEFTLLHTYLYNTLLTSHKHSNSTSAHLHTMPTHLTTSDQLLLWLFHLCGDRTSQLVMHFDYLHRSTLLRYIDHVSWCMNEVLHNCISWPTSAEKEALYGKMSIHQHAIAVLDGTHCRTQAPEQLNNTYYSGYKHTHTQNYLCCVDYMGMIIHIEGPFPGRPNDRACYNRSDLSLNQQKYLSGDEKILADGVFMGGPGLIVPIHSDTYSQPMDEGARRGMMSYNAEFTANRLIVEDVFGWLKQRACVLNTAWERHLDKQGAIFTAACKLHNFTRMLRLDYALQQYQVAANHSE